VLPVAARPNEDLTGSGAARHTEGRWRSLPYQKGLRMAVADQPAHHGNPQAGGPDYWVTPADLEQAAGRTRVTAQDVQEQLDEIRSYVMRLENEWTGSAHLQFLELMGDWDIYAKMLNDSLLDIAGGMEGNKVQYEDAERAAMQNLHHVNLPAARF
jgi:WXG100 family type VII secretion target